MKSILISVGVRLAAFNLKQIANLTCTDELDLYSIGEKKVALFCCIPDADTSMNYLVGMHWLLRIIRSLSVTHRPIVPYSPAPLTDQDKMRIDGALMGRGLYCEFGFEPVNLNTGNFYMDQSDATMNELNGEFSITRSKVG